MRMIFIFLLLCCHLVAVAQTSGSLHVIHLRFEGLKQTRQSHAERFLQTAIMDPVDIQRLEEDAQRLRNLTAFANAVVRLDTIPKGVIVTFEVTENHTFFPIVNFGGVRGNLWFQLGSTDVNLLGRGMQLTAFYLNNNGRSNFQLYYRLPYLRGSRWGITGSLFRFASEEPFFFPQGALTYDFENHSIGGTAFYEFELNRHMLEAGGLLFVERHRLQEGQTLLPGAPAQLEQPKVLFKIMHRLNYVNNHFFYRHGFDNLARYETVYALQDRSWFHMVFNDTHYYHRFGSRGNLAMRLRLGISTNSNSPFAPFILDSQFNIRGSGNRVDRGTATLTLNLEYRHTVYESNLFAAQVVPFSDLGTWRKPGGTLEELIDTNSFRHFAGGGIRLIYKKAWDAILRVDYGVDLYNREERGFVIGLGQYF